MRLLLAPLGDCLLSQKRRFLRVGLHGDAAKGLLAAPAPLSGLGLSFFHYSIFKVHSSAWRTRPGRAQRNMRTPTEREPNLGTLIQGLVFRCDFDEGSAVSEQVAIYSMGARASREFAAVSNTSV